MPEVLRRVVRVMGLLWVALAGVSFASEPAIRVAGSSRPAVLGLVDASVPPIALALAPDARNAAASYLDSEKPGRSIVRVYSTYRDEALEVRFPAVARSLIFSPDGLEIYVVLYRRAKKRQGDAQLSRLDVASGKTRQIMRLPATSSALDYWPARGSLLIAALNEVRTIRLAGMRSGPLFRIPGPNLAITALASSSVVLVGQERELLLIDLDDPSGENGMPVRERTPVPDPVTSLASLPDGSGAWARLSDGSLQRVSFAPLRIESAGSATALVALGKEEGPTRIALAPLPTPAQVPPVTEILVPEEGSGIAEAPTPEPTTPVEQPPIETSTQAPPPSRQPGGSAPTTPPWGGREAPQLWGRLTGEAVDAVQEVVLLGPNSIIREAQRVRPEANGFWRAEGLEPGRYQIQLSAGGRKVLVTEPRVALAEVSQSGSAEVVEFRVLRAFVP